MFTQPWHPLFFRVAIPVIGLVPKSSCRRTVLIDYFSLIGRRGLLGLATVTFAAASSWSLAGSQIANDAGPTAPIQRLDDALLASMRAGPRMSFAQRFATLTPMIEQTFDLDAILAASVGLRWPTLPTDQKAQVGAAFRRYTVASYAANFNSYSGQVFEIAPDIRAIGNGEVIVRTRLISADGTSTTLDYVMREGQVGWKAVDVLAAGAISRVAVQRSDFRNLLTGGGVPALVAALQKKVASLSGGMHT
jgi:phospholipid transport system substrate-binding protein